MSAAATPRQVLIVEDDDDSRDLLSAMVTLWGFNPLAADDAREGLQMLVVSNRRDPAEPCVVLLDLMMPGISGDAFGGLIAQHPSLQHVPVIVLSGAHDYQRRAAAIGAVAALSKPIDWERLKELLHEVCDRTDAD